MLAAFFSVETFSDQGTTKVRAQFPADVDADGSGNFAPANVMAVIDPATKQGTVLGAFDMSGNSAGQLMLQSGAQIRPQQVVIDTSGNYSTQAGSASMAAASLSVVSAAVGNEYQLGVRETDLAGNTDMAFAGGSGCAQLPGPAMASLALLLAGARTRSSRKRSRRQ